MTDRPIVSIDPGDGRLPMYQCGHLIGSGMHRSQADVDACAARAAEVARQLQADLEASRRPDYRGVSLGVTVEGIGVAAEAAIVLYRRRPGQDGMQEVAAWHVRYGHAALRPSWGFARSEPETRGQKGFVHGGLASFELALHAALADAAAEITIIGMEVDRRGVDADS